ncbi:MAG TPA: PDZ domain-containing protein, partial [Terriglobia bacterium]|nr:PDZ domain-containing protein [Terriglobia bacterium]
PYDEAFVGVGLRLVKSPESQPYTAGIVLDRDDARAVRLGALRTGSAAEQAGLQQGDVLLTIGGSPVARDNWFSMLNRYKQGDRIPMTVRRFRRTVELTLQMGPPDLYEYRIEEIANASAEAKRLRAAWLEGK